MNKKTKYSKVRNVFIFSILFNLFLQSTFVQSVDTKPIWEDSVTTSKVVSWSNEMIVVDADTLDGATHFLTENGESNEITINSWDAKLESFSTPTPPEEYDIRASGSVTTETTWSGTILVEGDVTVEQGVKLTIEPGSNVYFTAGKENTGGGDYDGLSEIIVRGTLIAEGDIDNPIIFTSDADTPTPSDWGAITIKKGSENVSFSYTVVEFAKQGVAVVAYDEGSASLSASIKNSLIRNNLVGTYIFSRPEYPAAGNVVLTPVIENNVYRDNVEFALSIRALTGYGTTEIGGNVTNNLIEGSETAILCESNSWWKGVSVTSISLNHNIVQGNVQGIVLRITGSADRSGSNTTNDAPIAFNNFFENDTAIVVEANPKGDDGSKVLSSPINYNEFSDNRISLHHIALNEGGYSLVPDIANNYIVNSQEFDFKNDATATLQIQRNYYGVAPEYTRDIMKSAGNVEVKDAYTFTDRPLLLAQHIDYPSEDEMFTITFTGINFGAYYGRILNLSKDRYSIWTTQGENVTDTAQKGLNDIELYSIDTPIMSAKIDFSIDRDWSEEKFSFEHIENGVLIKKASNEELGIVEIKESFIYTSEMADLLMHCPNAKSESDIRLFCEGMELLNAKSESNITKVYDRWVIRGDLLEGGVIGFNSTPWIIGGLVSIILLILAVGGAMYIILRRRRLERESVKGKTAKK